MTTTTALIIDFCLFFIAIYGGYLVGEYKTKKHHSPVFKSYVSEILRLKSKIR